MIIFMSWLKYKRCAVMKADLKILLSYVKEDLGRGDVTSENIIPEDLKIRGTIFAKKPGVLAGLEEVAVLLDHFGIMYKSKLEDQIFYRAYLLY